MSSGAEVVVCFSGFPRRSSGGQDLFVEEVDEVR